MLWLLVTVAAITLGYWFLLRPYKYWTRRGVKQGNPVPIFGENWGMFTRKQNALDMAEMIYNMFPNERYSGFYQFLLPTLLIRDPDLIKQITVKDFDHFVNHRALIPENCDPLFGGNLFALTDKRWRDMRNTLSPAFTSSKMKFMFSLISQSGEQFVNFFLKKNEDIVTIEMKDTYTRFTNDVIANAAFGIECDSLSNPTNEFYIMGKESTDFSGILKLLRFFGFIAMPKLCQFFKISLMPKEVANFFTRIIKSNIESRQQHNIVRPDMIHLLLEAQKNGLKYEESQSLPDTGFATVQESEISKNPRSPKVKITDENITAQAMIFFLAGFDTVSSLMSLMSHELAVNPDVQEKLIQEVDDTLELCKGKVTYEALLGMKYMDMVVTETLRKWPIAIFVDRMCTKPYTIEPKNPGERAVHLKKGDTLWFSLIGIHRDPQHYPDPDRFDPERFSEENKHKINPYAYLPFGSGPRNCIGSRFALLETKTLFFYTLTHFQIVPVEKTQIPLKLSKKQLNMSAENGYWLGFKRRVKV